MATSSLFHNFVIEGEENIRRFIDAFDRSMEMEEPPVPHNCEYITDPKELKEVFARQRKSLDAKREAAKNAR